MEIVRGSIGRRQDKRAPWLVIALACMAAALAAGYLLQILRQPSGAAMAVPESGFDLNYVASSSEAPRPRPQRAPASSMVGVISGGALATAPTASAPSEAPSASAAAAPSSGGAVAAAVSAVRDRVERTAQWATMLASPAKFLVGHTQLGSAISLRRFLADPASVQKYAGHPLVQEVLSSPTLVGLLMRPALARAFVGSPAMNDDAAVTALLRSPLTAQILRSPGVQQAMSDNADSVQALVNDPQVAQWLGKHPEATTTLGQVNPAFSALSLMGAAAPR